MLENPNELIRFQESELQDAYVNLYLRLHKKWGKPSVGRNRVTFAGKSCAIKIPRHVDGIGDNLTEAATYQRHKNVTTEYAKCRAAIIGDVEVLCMEKVHHVPHEELPTWANFYDCAQVGKNNRGIFVAYDYGN